MKYSKKPKIAILIPVGYRGGSLRGAKMFAEALAAGSAAAGEAAEIVLGHLDEPGIYSPEDFADLATTVSRRPFRWKVLEEDEVRRALIYAGREEHFAGGACMVPDDGINCFYDCDLWLIVSDRLQMPLLPIKPYALMVFDYLQRYVPEIMNEESHLAVIGAARRAERIFVTTEFSRNDALVYTGVPNDRITKLPMLTPRFKKTQKNQGEGSGDDYFVWTTNLTQHKNHERALKALSDYYLKHDGKLHCMVTGVETDNLFSSGRDYMHASEKIFASTPVLAERIHLLGNLPEENYQNTLESSAFLWHPGKIDNGTFSVIEAAHLGVPSLSSDYPAMREIDKNFRLSLSWMDSSNPLDMAEKLKYMECEAGRLREKLPDPVFLDAQSFDNHIQTYWREIRGCL